MIDWCLEISYITLMSNTLLFLWDLFPYQIQVGISLLSVGYCVGGGGGMAKESIYCSMIQTIFFLEWLGRFCVTCWCCGRNWIGRTGARHGAPRKRSGRDGISCRRRTGRSPLGIFSSYCWYLEMVISFKWLGVCDLGGRRRLASRDENLVSGKEVLEYDIAHPQQGGSGAAGVQNIF